MTDKQTIQENFNKFQEKHDRVDELVDKLLKYFLSQECIETNDKNYFYVSKTYYIDEYDEFEKHKLPYYILTDSNRLVLQTTINNNTSINILIFLLGYVYNEHCNIMGGNREFYEFFTNINKTKKKVIDNCFEFDNVNDIFKIFDYDGNNSNDGKDGNLVNLIEVNEDEKVKEPLLEACDFDSWLYLLQRYHFVKNHRDVYEYGYDGFNDMGHYCIYKIYSELPEKIYNFNEKNSHVVSEDIWRIDKHFDQCVYTIKDLIILNNSDGTGYVLK